jgi:Zn-dependent protease with chaperone function
LALAVTALVLGRLLLSAHVVGRELRAIRRRHREQLDLIGRRVSDRGVRVLDHELPVAYCVPGMAGSRIVMSSGALTRLDEHQLAAVLLHERAHLRARHDLVIEAFTVLHRAFPRAVSSGSSLAEVALLVEVLADRPAVRAGRARDLAAALLALAEGRLPAGAVGASSSGPGLLTRIHLLADRGTHRIQAALLLILAAAVLLLPTLFLVIPYLRDLP